MLQKISKFIDNLMFSYSSVKIITDKKSYNIKLNYLTVAIAFFLIVFIFTLTAYSLFISPFFKEKFDYATTRYRNQSNLMAEYNKQMLEKRELLKEINSNLVDAFEESEIDESLVKNLDKCKEAYCMLNGVVYTADDTRLNAISNIPNGYPTVGYTCDIGCAFGFRIDPFSGRLAMHYGIDIVNAYGTPIVSTMTGTVSFAGYGTSDTKYGGYGNVVVIDNGFYKTLYGHMSRMAVRYGQKVKKGQIIGYTGSTGVSTGVHLHYGVITYDYIDSQQFLK